MYSGRRRPTPALAVVFGCLTACLAVAGDDALTAPGWLFGLSQASSMIAIGALLLLMWQSLRAGEHRLVFDAATAMCVLTAIITVCRPGNAHFQVVSVVGAIIALSGNLLDRVHRG